MFQSIRLTCVLTLGAMALAAQSTTTNTLQTTAMAGIAYGQTARLNLLNPGVQPPALGVTCIGTVAYLGADGTVLKTASVTVAPGKSEEVDLHSAADLNLAAGDRREIRATIAIPAAVSPTSGTGTATATPVCKLISTLEIFDNLTLRTEAIVGKVESVD
jgi:hypothetical protein